MRTSISRAEWDAYIRRFHDERPGITDEILRRCTHGTRTPYEWTAAGIVEPRVLDLACGNGPLRSLLGAGWIGVDANHHELTATPEPRGGAVVGDVRRLPVRAGSCDAVVCSMALMLVAPLDAALAEIARVLRPGGTARLLLPSRRALRLRDQARSVRLAVALRSTTLFPPSPLYRHARATLARAGLAIDEDETRRFAYPIRDRADAELLVESLYLPGVEPARVGAAVDVAAAWSGSELGLPLRRISATLRPTLSAR